MLGVILLIMYCLFILLIFFDEVLKETAIGFCVIGLLYAEIFSSLLVRRTMGLLILIISIFFIIDLIKELKNWLIGRKKK